MLYLSGIQTEKISSKDMINKIVHEVEKKVSEIENNKQWYPVKKLKN